MAAQKVYFCVYACGDIFWLEKGFVMKFSLVTQYELRSFFVNSSVVRQAIQNLSPLSIEKCLSLKMFVLFFANSSNLSDKLLVGP